VFWQTDRLETINEGDDLGLRQFGQAGTEIAVQLRFELPFVRMRFESIQPPKPFQAGALARVLSIGDITTGPIAAAVLRDLNPQQWSRGSKMLGPASQAIDGCPM
jgi:hypothetical protein